MMHKSVIVLALLALVFATAHAQDGHHEEPQHKDEHHQEEHHGQEGAPATPTTPKSAPALPGKLHFIEAEFAETEGNMIAALEVFEKYATAVLHDPSITQPKDKKAVDKTVVDCAFGGNVDAVIKAHHAFLADLKQPNAQVEDALEKHLKPMLAEDITWMKAFTKRQDCLGKAEANKVVETVLKKTSVQLNPHAPTDKPKKEEKPKKEKKDKKDKKDKKPKKADKKIHPEPQPGAKEDKPEKRKAADVLKKLVPGFVKESWTKASTQVSGKYAAMLKAYEERQAKAEHKKQVKAAEYPNFDSKVIVIAQRYPRYKLLFVEMKKACAKEDHCKGSRLQKIEAVLKEVETACSDINKAI